MLNAFLAMIESLLGPAPQARRRSISPDAMQRLADQLARDIPVQTGVPEIRVGTIHRVERGYILVDHGGERVLIPKHELSTSGNWIDNPADVFQARQRVEFILTERGERGWKGSLHAVREARIRAALIESDIAVGGEVEAVVIELNDKGAKMQAGDCIPVWVPRSEISWSWIEHPSAALNLGQSARVKVSHIQQSPNWLAEKRERRTSIVGSIKACQERPDADSRCVSMWFRATPFRLSVSPKVPSWCDPVVLLVLQALAKSLSADGIARLSGLPLAGVQEIMALLADKGLQERGTVTPAGGRLLEAIGIAQAFSDVSLEGLFAGAAPQNRQLHSTADTGADDYPQDLPQPALNDKAVKAFFALKQEELPQWLLGASQADDARRKHLNAMLANPYVRTFLMRGKGWRPIRFEVPERWLLAGLWDGFDPVGEAPFRPPPQERGCRSFLMVRYCSQASGSVYWEPVSGTLWQPGQRARIRPLAKPCLDAAWSRLVAAIIPDADPQGQWCYASP